MRRAHAAVLAALFLSWSSTGVPASKDPPPVFLNHFFVVVDAATYQALQDSGFMTWAFAPFEKRTTTRNDQTYTGIYWYGRRTYFEVFEPLAQGPVGASGIAFGVESPGASRAVKAAWSTSMGGADGRLVTRRTETEEAPWFEMTYANAPSGTLRLWLMEYHRDFLARFHPTLTAARGTTRVEILDRYVAKIGRSANRDRALLRDVSGLDIALEPGEVDTLRKHVVSVGWSDRTEEGATVLAGPEGVTFRVVPARPGRRGIVAATFSLQRTAPVQTDRLGAAVLNLEGDRAILRFTP